MTISLDESKMNLAARLIYIPSPLSPNVKVDNIYRYFSIRLASLTARLGGG
jgi:hypothetical protein